MTDHGHLEVDRQFLSGGGEIGLLMRAMDWHETSLGPIHMWPESLRTIVSICLNSTFPIAIFWGKDFFHIHNDAMLPILGESHSPALGMPAKDTWAERWEILEPMLQRVFSQRKPASAEHQLVLLRRNGFTEQCYFTFSLSPVEDYSGGVGGAFLTLTETSRENTSARHMVPVIHSPMKGAKNPKILVADVNPDIMDYIRKILSPEFWVDTSSSATSALAKIIQSPPDLVITDSMLPAPNGSDLLNAMKSDTRTADIPVIVLTVRPEAEVILDDQETGADDYLIKPFTAKELIARVNAQIKSRQERRSAEEFLRDVFAQAPVPICFLKGSEFQVEQANANMLELWGKKSEEVIGKPMASVFPEMVAQGFFHVLGNVFKNGVRFMAEEVPLIIKRGEKFEKRFVSFVYEPFKGADGTVNAIVIVGHDVTHLVEVRKDAQQHALEFEQQVSERTAELKAKNEELVFKNAELEQFTFLASHDLQEPLRKIQTFSGLMMYNLHDPGIVEKYVNKIVASVSRMSGLIQSLLEYSKVSQIEQTFVNVDLNQTLRYVLDDLELPITEKGGMVRADNLPVIGGDPRQLGQLFLNLIQNAIKFCNGKPIVTITWHTVEKPEKIVRKSPDDKKFICIDFEDNGIGFDQVFSEKIFEIFKRLHGPAEYTGTGIGLALCKKIVEHHGGAITVESRVGKGTTFHVYLPE